MGLRGSKEAAEGAGAGAGAAGDQGAAGAGAGAGAAAGGCPVRRIRNEGAGAGAGEDSCPVRYKNSKVYNVYGEAIDPTNMMPAQAQQLPSPGQAAPLSQHRVQSGIAKGGTESTWVYPSEQMFYNALVRKGKGEDVGMSDVEMMVAIHNNMNEKTWKQLLIWERMHCKKCDDPRLLRFTGRPDELSLRARVKSLIGYTPPFDRHDWVVDRCGQEVRYIIDYYHNESLPVDSQKPRQFDFASNTQIELDVRPALDSFTAFGDRLRYGFMKLLGGEPREPQDWPRAGQGRAGREEGGKELAKEWSKEQKQFMEKMEEIAKTCSSRIQDYNTCNGEEDCSRKLLAKDVCVAEITCVKQAKNFLKALEKGDEKEIGKKYEEMVNCTLQFKEKGEKLFV